jgi:hypothetical protein
LDFGSKTGSDVIMSLIVDDGVYDRGHRENIFEPDFLVCGIAAAEHKSFRTVIAIDYSKAYYKKGQKPKKVATEFSGGGGGADCN